MKTRSIGLVVLIFGCILALAAVSSFAGTKAPGTVKLQAPYKHKKTPVTFSHTKHTTDYKLNCGECHHDDKGKARKDLKEGDAVKKCFECHNKPGQLKGKKAKGKSKAEKIAYHANAMHKNCIGCHKAYNKKNKTKAAPQKCTGCHPKKKK